MIKKLRFTAFFILLILGFGKSLGDVLLSYESGITTSDVSGAADPESQGWTYTGAGSGFSDGFDAGLGVESSIGGGWRTVDGTGGAQSVYTQDTTSIIGAITAAPSWKMTWTVAVDLDAVRQGGSKVVDYYGQPNQGRQNALLLYFDMDDVDSFRVVHRVNELNEVLLDVSGTQYNTGVMLDAFGTYSITYNSVTGTAELDYGAGTAVIAPTTVDPNRSTIFMGSGSTGGQGSAVWNSLVVETITVDPPSEPAVIVTSGSGLSASSLNMTGEVTDSGNELPVVTLYYGATDGGIDAVAWDQFVDLGRQGGGFSSLLENLSSNETVFYRAFAENSAGSVWSPSTESATSLQPTAPVIVVTVGTSESPGQANFNGRVTDNGNEDPEVTIFYGTTDGGTNPAAWDEIIFDGVSGGDFSQAVIGLAGNTTYFYRAFAENSVGAAWSETTESVTTLGFTGVPNILASDSFDYRYEMDVNPGSQDLDTAGNISDWFANPAIGSGVDQEMWTPQTYEGGIASSNQEAVIPEALFRSDYGGSITRQSIAGDFTVEVALRLKEGTIVFPDFDLGGFAMFLNPPGQDSLRLNINENEMSTGFGDAVTATASNTGGMTVFRVAYVEADQRFWVWRDGALVYGDTPGAGGGVEGSEPSVYAGGGFLLGDFASDISGDWDLEYIRVHNEAVAPTGANLFGEVAITGFGFVNETTVFIDYLGESGRAYNVLSSTNLTDFTSAENPINGTTTTTNAEGIGRVEIGVAGRVPGKLFFRVEKP